MNRSGCFVRRNPCPEEEGEAVEGPALSNWHDLSARLILRHHMGWPYHPSLVGGPKAAEAGVLQPHPWYL